LSRIFQRQFLCFPAYSWILWLATKVLGTSEIALRIPSILAMFTAAGLIYRIAREMFDRELALIATILFCINPITIFAAIDVRPYAFAVLATNAAILTLLRLRQSGSARVAALFGALAAMIVWFHYLFAAILPGFVIAYWAMKRRQRSAWRQFGVAMAAFTALLLPALSGLHLLFRTGGTHVYEKPPSLSALYWTLLATWVGPVALMTVLLALVMTVLKVRPDRESRFQPWQVILCASTALVPVLILYGISVGTPIHLFVARHRLVAVPGIALCWTLVLSRIRYGGARLGFCLALVGFLAYFFYAAPIERQHAYSWKSAVQVVDRNASVDRAPVLMCSDFPEANTETLPEGDVRGSRFFSPLSYYKPSVPVYGLPRALNDEARRRIGGFVEAAAQRRQRFLAMAVVQSYPTLDWISAAASSGFEVHNLGVYDGVKILEFDPRTLR
jgi:uncharacterized membrane protein